MSESQIPQSVLSSNLNIIKSIADAVKGTFGPQGLDVMLIDQFGEYTVTNDGVKILSLIETNHPAAKMLIEAAKTQEAEVGDGTTTVTILTEAILSEAVKQVEKGVPITKLIEGIKLGLAKILKILENETYKIDNLEDAKLHNIALIAGREEIDLVNLVLQASAEIGLEKLKDPNFKFAKTIIAKPQAKSELIKGVIINKNKTNAGMPSQVREAKVLIFDDNLAPEDLPQEAIGTEQGFAQFKNLQQSFLTGLKRAIDLGVKLVLIDGNLHPYAEEMFVGAGIIAVQRVRSSELHRAAEFTKSQIASRRTLNLSPQELQKYLGFVELAEEDSHLGFIRLEGKNKYTSSEPLNIEGMSTLIIGASTEAVANEKERIATDIASSIQAALRGGVIAGGGIAELGLISALEELKKEKNQNLSLAYYGIDCLISALKKPLSQICLNAGLNPLEKVTEVLAAQNRQSNKNLGLNFNTGEIVCMLELGILDPTLVKISALKTACEVVIQILKVSIIIKSRQI